LNGTQTGLNGTFLPMQLIDWQLAEVAPLVLIGLTHISFDKSQLFSLLEEINRLLTASSGLIINDLTVLSIAFTILLFPLPAILF
jgi:hypothetical protein